MNLKIILPLLLIQPLPLEARSLKSGFVDAVTAGDTAAAERLLSQRPSLIKTKYQGSPLIFYTAVLTNTNTALVLIKAGAKVNVRAKNGLTPLLWAIINKNEALVRLLLINGADALAVDKDKINALSYAVKSGDKKIVSLMMRYRIDPFTPDRSGKTPFIYAVEQNNPDILKMIDEYQKIRKIYSF